MKKSTPISTSPPRRSVDIRRRPADAHPVAELLAAHRAVRVLGRRPRAVERVVVGVAQRRRDVPQDLRLLREVDAGATRHVRPSRHARPDLRPPRRAVVGDGDRREQPDAHVVAVAAAVAQRVVDDRRAPTRPAPGWCRRRGRCGRRVDRRARSTSARCRPCGSGPGRTTGRRPTPAGSTCHRTAPRHRAATSAGSGGRAPSPGCAGASARRPRAQSRRSRPRTPRDRCSGSGSAGSPRRRRQGCA